MNELILQQQQMDQPLTVSEMVSQVSIIQQMLTQVMKKDTHFGIIPGTPAPTLYKAGAEKIMLTFRLASEPIVEDLCTDDEIRYRVTVRLTSPSGRFIGAGLGECSSQEEKYCWRYATCPEEFEEAPVDKRREKWKRGWNGKPATKSQQVRTNVADIANTVLKMAKKRALVDAVLTSTAASDVFAQDLEDLPHEYVQSEVVSEGPPKQQKPRPTPLGVAQNQGADDADTQDLLADLTEKAGHGWDTLQKAWGDLSDKQRQAIGARFRNLKEIAMNVDGGE